MSVSPPEASSASARPEMPLRKLATITGVLWIVTFITSIPAMLLYDSALDRGFITGAGAATPVYIGATLELILIIANIGTAILPYALFRRYSERLALGFVAARVIESVFIAGGIVSVLAITFLRQDPDGASNAALIPLGQSLMAVHDVTFLLGPGFVVGVGNGLILGWLMYTSGLLPRRLAILGLIGGPLLILSAVGIIFDLWEPRSGPQVIATIPEFIWELSIGVYLITKGFRTPAPAGEEAPETEVDPGLAVAAR